MESEHGAALAGPVHMNGLAFWLGAYGVGLRVQALDRGLVRITDRCHDLDATLGSVLLKPAPGPNADWVH